MASIPFRYSARSVMRRHLAFAMTFVGIAVVVAIFVMMLAMVRGLRTTLADMGDPSNVIVLGRSSMVEATSSIPRETFAVLGELPEIARILEDTDADRSRVVLMPEGTTSDAIRERAPWLTEICKREGFRYSPRLHIDLWGNRRGV